MRTSSLRSPALVTLLLAALALAPATAGASPQALLSARTLAANGQQDASPVWSPNGKELAYSNENTTTGQWRVYVVNANGGGRHLVSHGRLSYQYVAWAPNSRQVGFSGLTNGEVISSGHIYVVDGLTGTGQTPVTTGNGWYDVLFGWSPNGQSIYFDRVTNGVDAIYTMNPNGTNLHELTPTSTDDDYWAVWSPDGTRLAFDRTSSSTFGNIWVMDADGSRQRQLTNNPDDNFGSAWSPNSKEIAFQSNRTAPGSDRYEIYVMSSSGGAQQELTHVSGGAAEPSFSPNGKQILFEGMVDGNWQVFTMNANGSGQKQLTTGTYAANSDPSWSPNGKQIAFLSTRGGGVAIYVMNADGSGQKQLS